MSIPAGYTQSPSGFYFYTDGSGPYAIGQDGTPQLVAAGGGVSGSGSVTVSQLLPGGTTGNVTGSFVARNSVNSTIQGTVTGTGAVATTITLQGSNDGVNVVATSLAVITLSGTTTASDGFALSAPWPFVRAVVSGSSGTISAITCSIANKS